jgi:hypothetical protein
MTNSALRADLSRYGIDLILIEAYFRRLGFSTLDPNASRDAPLPEVLNPNFQRKHHDQALHFQKGRRI